MSTNLLFKWFRRETAFFWVGMFIIPIFWVWWTLHPRFKSWERALAIKWTAVWITFIWIRFDQLPDYFDAAARAFPGWCMFVGFCLWAVFFFRWLNFTLVLVMYLSMGMGLGQAMHRMSDSPVAVFFWVALAVACNLLLNPTRRTLRLLELRLQRRLNRWWYE